MRLFRKPTDSYLSIKLRKQYILKDKVTWCILNEITIFSKFETVLTGIKVVQRLLTGESVGQQIGRETTR